MPTHTHPSIHRPHRRRKPHFLFGNFPGFLSFLEGIESGFATTCGILLGLWFQNPTSRLLIITAVVSLLINAVNSASIKFMSEHTFDELDGREKHRVILNALSPALVQFTTHVIMASIVLIPVFVIYPSIYGIFASIALTIVVLSAAGWYRGHTSHGHAARDALESVMLALLIIAAGGGAGLLLSL